MSVVWPAVDRLQLDIVKHDLDALPSHAEENVLAEYVGGVVLRVAGGEETTPSRVFIALKVERALGAPPRAAPNQLKLSWKHATVTTVKQTALESST